MSGSLDTVEVRRLLEEQIQRRAKALEDFTDATNKVAALASLLHAEGEQMPDGIVIAT